MLIVAGLVVAAGLGVVLFGCGGAPFTTAADPAGDAGPVVAATDPQRDATPPEAAQPAPEPAPEAGPEPSVEASSPYPPGCSPSPTVCQTLGAAACTGWQCMGDAGLPTFDGERCEPLWTVDTFACGPYWVGSYLGDDAGNGCVSFHSNWCGGGITVTNGMGVPTGWAFVCPASVTQGPPGSCRQVNTPSDGTTGWCCP